MLQRYKEKPVLRLQYVSYPEFADIAWSTEYIPGRFDIFDRLRSILEQLQYQKGDSKITHLCMRFSAHNSLYLLWHRTFVTSVVSPLAKPPNPPYIGNTLWYLTVHIASTFLPQYSILRCVVTSASMPPC